MAHESTQRPLDHFGQMQQRSFRSIYEPGVWHKKEESRRKSFSLWPSSAQASSRQLAAAGFFYTGDEDICQCFSCDLKLKDWRLSDDPREKHRQNNPYCPMVTNAESGNVPLQKERERSDTQPDGHVNCMSAAKATSVRCSSTSDGLSENAMSVARRFGFEQDVINTAHHRLKEKLGEFQS